MPFQTERDFRLRLGIERLGSRDCVDEENVSRFCRRWVWSELANSSMQPLHERRRYAIQVHPWKPEDWLGAKREEKERNQGYPPEQQTQWHRIACRPFPKRPACKCVACKLILGGRGRILADRAGLGDFRWKTTFRQCNFQSP